MQRRAVRWAVAGAGLLAVLASALGVLLFKRYVDTDPGLCAQCHRASPEFALWTKGSHRSVACQRCHHSTPEQGLSMLRAFVAGRPPGGQRKHAEVELGACAGCHLSHDPRWPQIESSRGHRVHVSGKGVECVKCHAQAMHGFTPVVETCRGCHGEHAVRAPGMQQLHCFACHDFLSQDPGLRPSRSDCLRCHRESGVHPGRFSEAAPMQFACAACHHPHARSAAEERISCLGCHPGVPRAGLHAPQGHRRCLDCHQAHLWKSGDRTCGACHPEPHVAAPRGAGERCATCHGFHGAGEPRPPPVSKR
jgi:hypothetical protein